MRLYCKGADDVILERVNASASDDVTMQRLNEFAAQGLRTLAFAHRDLDEAEYKSWAQRFSAANTSLHEREKKLAAVYAELETNLTLSGSSAIEDKLQEGVPETIQVRIIPSISNGSFSSR